MRINDDEDTQKESSSALASGWQASASRERVLHPLMMVIDDSICVRKIVETTLRREGYATLGFADGESALRWLSSEQAQTPALIILDVTLPKMDGYTVLRCLRKCSATAHTPVVMLSRHSGVLDRLKGRLAGACVYLTKPFRQRTILEVVQAQLGSPHDDARRSYGRMARHQAATVTPHAALRPITLQRMEAPGW